MHNFLLTRRRRLCFAYSLNNCGGEIAICRQHPSMRLKGNLHLKVKVPVIKERQTKGWRGVSK